MEITDNHFHLDPRGLRGAAVQQFVRAGGTRLVLVHKPYGAWSMPADFRAQVSTTLRLAAEARAAGAAVAVVAAPHPVELVRLVETRPLAAAEELYLKAIDHCAALVTEGELVGLGEVGRPHFAVAPEIRAAADRTLRGALERAREAGGAAVLHTEAATPEVMAELAEIATAARFPLDRLVKHYGGPGALAAPAGLTVSLPASRSNVRAGLAAGGAFMLETDYLDDPGRPGAVMGPKTVPRRTLAALADGTLSESAAHRIHVELPERVYGTFA